MKGALFLLFCVYAALESGVFDLRMMNNRNILCNSLKKALIWEGRVLQFSVNALSLSLKFSISLLALRVQVLEALKTLTFLGWVTVGILISSGCCASNCC